MDQGRNIADKASETVKEGYKAAQQYAQDNLSVDIADFVRREPWMAITAAFAIGYVAAQIGQPLVSFKQHSPLSDADKQPRQANGSNANG
jgi:hypothetical protein